MDKKFETLNHSASHLLAHAIHRLYPNALFGIGPSIEEGFYYDIDFEGVKVTIKGFSGLLEGNGYSIQNVKVKNGGLFSCHGIYEKMRTGRKCALSGLYRRYKKNK